MSFYAVRVGRVPGIYSTWDACRAQVDGFSGAQHKKFHTELEAQNWIKPSGTLGLSGTSETPMIDSESRLVKSPWVPDWGQTYTTYSDFVSIPSTSSKLSVKSFTRLSRLNVYVDGACPNNGAATVAGIGVYFVETPSKSFAERLPEAPFTNNRAEIYAAIRALEVTTGSITLYSDSEQVVNTMTKWLPKRLAAKWNGTVNAELYQRLYRLTYDRDVRFEWVPAHVGVPGNEAANRLATDVCR